MKVLQINCVYPNGSTGKIVQCIHYGLLKKHINSIILYAHGKKYQDRNLIKITNYFFTKLNALISRITGLMYCGCITSTETAINIIKKENPDIVHLHCINGYTINIPHIIAYLKQNNINTILTLHAEFMYTGNCGHAFDCERWKSGCGKCPRLKQETKSYFFDNTARSWRLMKKAFDDFDDHLHVISVSPWLMERAKLSPILQGKQHSVIMNGVDTHTFHLRTSTLREELHLKNKKIVFHVTASFNSEIKGGKFILKLAELLPHLIFIIAGKVKKNKYYPQNVIFLDYIDDQNKLAELYSIADITLLTSKKETFSMPVAESLCCGTPVVGFEAGGPESIAIKDYSYFVEYENIEKLKEAISIFLNKKFDKEAISKKAKSIYSHKVMTENYINLYKKALAHV